MAYGRVPFLATGLAGLYSVGSGLESWKYWRDYQKNTGYSPRYPYRSGQYDYVRAFAGYGMSLTNQYYR